MKRTLTSPVLVLNKSWVAIGTCAARDAISDICRGAARGLCMESFQLHEIDAWMEQNNPPKVSGFAKAAGGKLMPIPDAIVLSRYDKLHRKAMYLGNKSLFIRDGYTCQYCKRKFKGKDLSLDHIVPRSRNGKTEWSNVVTSCIPCNQSKADKSLRDAGYPPFIPKPSKPRWSPVMHITPHARLESWGNFVK